MRPFAVAMIDNLVAIAAGVHQGVGQDRQALKDTLVIDGAGAGEDRGG